MGGMEKHEVSKYIYIAAMGFVGAFMRIVVDALVPVTGFPVATFVVNIVACFCLEVVYSFVGRRLHFPKKLVSAMGVGLIGSFSTMSSRGVICWQGLTFLSRSSGASSRLLRVGR